MSSITLTGLEGRKVLTMSLNGLDEHITGNYGENNNHDCDTKIRVKKIFLKPITSQQYSFIWATSENETEGIILNGKSLIEIMKKELKAFE